MTSAFRFRHLLTALAGLIAVPAHSAVVFQDDFTTATGWSDNRLYSVITYGGESILGGYNLFGAGAYSSRTIALSGTQTSVDIAFRIYKFDTWDAENFHLYVDGGLEFSRTFYQYFAGPDETVFHEPGGAYDNMDSFVDVLVSYATTASSITVAFTSTLNQNPADESWGIDNFVLSDDTVEGGGSVPAPETVGLMLLGLGALRRRFIPA